MENVRSVLAVQQKHRKELALALNAQKYKKLTVGIALRRVFFLLIGGGGFYFYVLDEIKFSVPQIDAAGLVNILQNRVGQGQNQLLQQLAKKQSGMLMAKDITQNMAKRERMLEQVMNENFDEEMPEYLQSDLNDLTQEKLPTKKQQSTYQKREQVMNENFDEEMPEYLQSDLAQEKLPMKKQPSAYRSRKEALSEVFGEEEARALESSGTDALQQEKSSLTKSNGLKKSDIDLAKAAMEKLKGNAAKQALNEILTKKDDSSKSKNSGLYQEMPISQDFTTDSMGELSSVFENQYRLVQAPPLELLYDSNEFPDH